MAVHRAPWPADFPRVVLHTTVRVRDAHPDYEAAKGGDVEAAARLSDALIDKNAMAGLAAYLATYRNPVFLPVHAEEDAGFNAIPLGMCQFMQLAWDIPIDDNIVQINKVSHTRADGFTRLARQPLFSGELNRDADYVIVDDHFGMGGTIANLRGYVMAHGGCIVGASTLTASRRNDIIALSAETHSNLQRKFGTALDEYFQEEFGFNSACLTEPEGSYLLRVEDVDEIRGRILAAKGS
jgi:hypothetical protein